MRTIPSHLAGYYRSIISVKDCAQRLGLSRQRVRVLLGSRRLKGEKDNCNIWWVVWPLQLRLGQRGPKPAYLPAAQQCRKEA